MRKRNDDKSPESFEDFLSIRLRNLLLLLANDLKTHRSATCYTTRGKHFDNLESFLKALDAFEKLHDVVKLEINFREVPPRRPSSPTRPEDSFMFAFDL